VEVPSSEPTVVNRYKWGPGQSRLWRADLRQYRTLLACAGEQGGKTILGAYWLKRLIKEHLGRKFNYVVLCPTYKILSQSTLPTFKQAIRNIGGQYNGKEDAWHLPDGGFVFFRSSTDPDSMVGIPNCKAGWIDEAGKCSRASYFGVVGRVARLEGPIILTTTPYSLNWVKRDVIDPYERGRLDILYCRWPSSSS
jgi:phage terminase large subunit-like protein